jgi:hypothetical protein
MTRYYRRRTDMKNSLKWTLLATLVAVGLVLISLVPGTQLATQQAANLLFLGDFEGGDLQGFLLSGDAPQVVSAPYPVRAGSYSARFYLHRYQSGRPERSELYVADDGSEFLFDVGGEYWFGFSVYIPEDWVPDVARLTDVFVNIQALPDSGESWLSPVLSLEIDQLNWRGYSRWGGSQPTQEALIFDGIPVERGKWTDWVVHVKWSYQSDGFLEVWRNGAQIVSRTGPNCSNDGNGPQFQFGIYKWPWTGSYETNTNWRLLYFDELRIADADASYEDVAPGGQAQPPTTNTPTATSTRTPTSTGTSTAMATASYPDYCETLIPTLTPRPTLTRRPTYTPYPTPTDIPTPTPTCPPRPTATEYPTAPPYPTPTYYPTPTSYPRQGDYYGSRTE